MPSRTRSRGGFHKTAYVQHYKRVSNGQEVTLTFDTGRETGMSETVSDDNHPGWRKSSTKGNIIMGPVVLVRTTKERSLDGYCGYTSSAYNPSELYGDLTGFVEDVVLPPLMPAIDNNRMGTVALIKALASINASPLMGGENWHDLDATLGMLRRPFGGASQLLSKMLKYKAAHAGKTAASATKAAAKAWLEYRYGWKPLFLDCGNIIEEVNTRRSKCERRRLVARSQQSDNRSLTKTFADVGNATGFTADGSVTVRNTSRVCVGVLYDVLEQTSLDNLNRVIGFRPRDLASTVWECIPYSFVVDWFVNVGDWLQAVTPVPGVTIQRVWRTIVETQTTTYSGGVLRETVEGKNFTGHYGKSETTMFQYFRELDPVLPPHPVLTGKPLSPLHSLDGLSLLAGNLLSSLGKLRH